MFCISVNKKIKRFLILFIFNFINITNEIILFRTSNSSREKVQSKTRAHVHICWKWAAAHQFDSKSWGQEGTHFQAYQIWPWPWVLSTAWNFRPRKVLVFSTYRTLNFKGLNCVANLLPTFTRNPWILLKAALKAVMVEVGGLPHRMISFVILIKLKINKIKNLFILFIL